MKNFLFKRILVMIPVFFGMTILVFLLSNLTPGSPVDAMITPEMTPADIEALYSILWLKKLRKILRFFSK